MERLVNILVSFAPDIIIPAVYTLLAGGKNGLIKKAGKMKTDTKGKIFFCGLATGVMSVLLWLAVINLVAFVLMAADKSRAKRQGARRIPEKTLFLSALLGGSVGAILGMQLFRHKTKHWYFVWGMPLILIAQIALALWLGSL